MVNEGVFAGKLIIIYSEDVFESSEEELPAWKARKLGKSIRSQFGPIIDTILEILSKADTPSLVETTLKTLQHFIKWLPKDVIYSPSLVEALGMRVNRSKYRCSV